MQCVKCDKVFKTKQNLNLHLDKKIPCDRKLECKNCKKVFKTNQKLNNHINNITKCEKVDPEIELELVKNELYEYKKLNLELKEELINNKSEVDIKNLATVKKAYTTDIPIYKETNNFNEYIKSVIQEDFLELVPIFDKLTTHKGLNKIDINTILSQYNRLLSITDLLYIINYNLDKLYVDKFWNNIESDSWIYLDEELIQWFGYKEISRGKESIVKLLKKYHELDDEYKILNNEEYKIYITDFSSARVAEPDFNNNFKHILMNSDSFKNICMVACTEKAKIIRQYFIEIEKIFKFYIKYTLEFNKYELNKTKLIKNRYINKAELKINSKLYLITNQFKAKENIFKFGSTADEKARKSAYNTGHVEADKFFYAEVYDCYDAISLEKRIAKLLINFKIPNESEMYQLHFTALDTIIKLAIQNDMNSLSSINTFLTSDYDKYLNLEPVKF